MAERGLILIVDDEPLNVDLLEQELDLLGHDTIAAADGLAALAHLARQPVDLVLLDIMMPQLDGYEVLRRIKGDPDLRHVPVIMISEDHLPKPFEPVVLKARVGACLEKKRWHDREIAYRREIERERERADRLLHVILPAPAVVELKASERIVPRRHDEVAVMFADIVGFTAYCEAHAAEDVVDNLDRLARDCEALMSAHGLEKIKTIGDGFVTTGNLLQPLDDPVMASVRCALAMLRAGAENPARWQLRVGIHVGPVVAGVVGQSKFSFDLWGDTVNVAARLSGLGSEAAIHLSGEAFARVEGRCRCVPLGPIEFKGGRRILVYRHQE